jgi:hypothetical protein
MTLEQKVERILAACPGLTAREGRGVWLRVPKHWEDAARLREARMVYEAFPPGYTFLIHFNISRGGAANQPFVTGQDPFPLSYGGKKVVYLHQEMHVSGPSDLLRTLINLTTLTTP